MLPTQLAEERVCEARGVERSDNPDAYGSRPPDADSLALRGAAGEWQRRTSRGIHVQHPGPATSEQANVWG
jgi:hypothetical protein